MHFSFQQQVTIREIGLRDAILTCDQKLAWVSLIYRTEPTTKKWKNRRKKTKSRKRNAQKYRFAWTYRRRTRNAIELLLRCFTPTNKGGSRIWQIRQGTWGQKSLVDSGGRPKAPVGGLETRSWWSAIMLERCRPTVQESETVFVSLALSSAVLYGDMMRGRVHPNWIWNRN